MPKKLINDYTFYKIVCLDNSVELCYVGSTANWKERQRQHRSNCNNENVKSYNSKKYQIIRANGGWDNFEMIQLGTREQLTKRQADQVKEEYRVELKANMNSQRCFTTEQQKKEEMKEYQQNYYEENKDKIKEQQQNYYEVNKDKILEQQQNYYEENKDKIIERQNKYNEENKDKIKEYREENRDKLIEQQKNYREENKDKIKEIQQNYYESNKDKIIERQNKYNEENKDKIKAYQQNYCKENRDKINEKQREKVKCDCGCMVVKNYLLIHQKSPKHIKLMEEKKLK